MEIYKYNPNCQKWGEILNNKNLKNKEKEIAFETLIVKIGTKLTLQEYFALYDRESNFMKGVCYRCIGTPANILEELAYSEIEYHEQLHYTMFRDRRAEDLIESRTSWGDLKEYADNLASFIERIKDEIGNGKLSYNNEID